MDYLRKLKEIYRNYLEYRNAKIPLCAAETYMSDFVRQGLSSEFEGQYIQGYKERAVEKDNIGSDKIYPLMLLVEDLCAELYGAKYADARTLSGMNCMAILVMALIPKESTVFITTREMGGHPSLASILDNLGIRYLPVPYNFEKRQVNYEVLDMLLAENEVSYLIFCQSDILVPPDLTKIHLQDSTGIIYDASQTLGLIASAMLPNPLDAGENIIMIGGTHKTLPGPTCGLIMTRNQEYAHKIDYIISPTLLRNIQPNNVAALCLALIEQKEQGRNYQNAIVRNANILGGFLKEFGISVVQPVDGVFTQTHQLFLEFDEITTERIYKNALHYNITLNKRISKLYTGIRLGVQEITRYNYTEDDLRKIALLIFLIAQPHLERERIRGLCLELSRKKNATYILEDLFME